MNISTNNTSNRMPQVTCFTESDFGFLASWLVELCFTMQLALVSVTQTGRDI